MENFARNISRDTFSTHMKATLALQQRMDHLKVTPDEKKMKSVFVPAKETLQYAHTLPISKRLQMYNLNRPLSPPRYYIIKKKKSKPKKSKKSSKVNDRNLPSSRINLSQKITVSVQYSPRFSPAESSPHSIASPREFSKWIIEDNVETLVQKYASYEGDDEHSD